MSSVSIGIANLRQICDPVTDPPWSDLVTPVTEGDVRWAMLQKDWTPDHMRPLADFHAWSGLEHARRIAWMVDNPPEDPISIDADLALQGRWAVTDGNHRFYAAIMRGASDIMVEICGHEHAIAELFGRDVADKIFEGADIEP